MPIINSMSIPTGGCWSFVLIAAFPNKAVVKVQFRLAEINLLIYALSVSRDHQRADRGSNIEVRA